MEANRRPTAQQQGPLRRYLAGYCQAKDNQGRFIGATSLRLRRRNAWELVGLRRPRPAGRAESRRLRMAS